MPGFFHFFDDVAISKRRFEGVDYGKMKMRLLFAPSQWTRKVENLITSLKQVFHTFLVVLRSRIGKKPGPVHVIKYMYRFIRMTAIFRLLKSRELCQHS